MGTMTDEAKALVEALRELERDLKPFAHKTVGSIRIDLNEVRAIIGCPDLIETQAREIERLRGAFLETREMLGLAEQVICEECCPTTWKTADGQPHSPLHEDIRAVLFKHEATRDEARAALGDSHD